MKFKCNFCGSVFDLKGEGFIRFWRERRFNVCNKCKKKADSYIAIKLEQYKNAEREVKKSNGRYK